MPTIDSRSHASVHPVTTETHAPPATATERPATKQPVERTAAGAVIDDLNHVGNRPRGNSLPPQFTAKPQVSAIPRAKHGIDDLGSFVPKAGGNGQRLAQLAHALGLNRKGLSPVSFAAKRPAKDGLNGIATAAHGHYGYEAAPATDLVNAVASGSNAIAAHSIHSRYENKLQEMLAADVERFEHPGKRPHGAPIANRVDNLLLTKDGKGKWQYDRSKLARIARDDSHPLTQHARDVLTTISIAENKGKQRNGAFYQSVTSTIGLAASGLLIGGSHGALTPLVASGHLTNALKEALDLKKPFVEGRQNVRNAKAETIQHYVDTVLAKHDYTGHTADAALQQALKNRRGKLDELRAATTQPEGEGLPTELSAPQAQAGIYATIYDDARRYANGKTSLGKRLIAGAHAEDKAKVHKDAERDLAVKHILSMITKSIGRLDEGTLEVLAGADMAVDGTHAQRAKQALSIVVDDARVSRNRDLAAAHMLLRDAGLPKHEAALLLSQLARAQREKPAQAPASSDAARATPQPTKTAPTEAERMKKIADIIGQPGLTSSAAKTAEDAVKKNLGLRS